MAGIGKMPRCCLLNVVSIQTLCFSSRHWQLQLFALDVTNYAIMLMCKMIGDMDIMWLPFGAFWCKITMVMSFAQVSSVILGHLAGTNTRIKRYTIYAWKRMWMVTWKRKATVLKFISNQWIERRIYHDYRNVVVYIPGDEQFQIMQAMANKMGYYSSFIFVIWKLFEKLHLTRSHPIKPFYIFMKFA